MWMALVGAVAGFEAFAFLEGRWCGAALGGDAVERWEAPVGDAPAGDAMTGSMTLVKDGKVAFHEFFAILRGADGFELRLKHFAPNLVSWEEREEVVVFPLIGQAPGSLEFEGLAIQGDTDRLLVTVAGERPVVFDYHRCER